ncbi:hypothetical protein [Rhodopirellula sp. MGV]|uniref:hypothetical protein n=1 Tax=Rhodopirellula sp. MGV TaxID=2023130 RepID=UPI000B972596|nr:hypothetical protein [Rhodopirellula sp. MGV]OYP38817.1 hypothetical protein CGZ80_00920 [Rhodopirellula sp. MGV]PNY37628.1 hypothetical protein C2E31_06655 [Rhodopirellula baltica]
MSGTRSIYSIVGVLVSALLTAGCTSDDRDHQSHFDHDHLVVEHWPDDLTDVSRKIRKELDATKDASGEKSASIDRIRELVSWGPEFAADSELTERQWIPIADASTALTKRLDTREAILTPEDRDAVLRFCDLIDRAATSLAIENTTVEASELPTGNSS